MKWALLFGLGGTGAVIVMLCIVLLFLRHRLLRQHRVHYAQPTAAPITWLVDPRRPARLHRRLTKVGRTASAVADDHRRPSRRFRRAEEDSPIVGVAHDLRRQAVEVDHQLARLSSLSPIARQRPVTDLSRSVGQLEQAAARLVTLSSEVRTPVTLSADHPGLFDITAQLDRMSAAHQALLDLDANAGLAPQPRPAAPPPRQRSMVRRTR